uniref:Thiol:disulfide interchange protein n=1 Tax=Flintiella sanguinaria TaxID=101926 RepID=A0A1X9PU83_9RHOD|nr:thiol:disulfide interchange protein [Flintiella sanguinaria]
MKYSLDSLNFYYMNNMSMTSISIILLTGIISGINPCTISIIPVYLNYLNNKKYSPLYSIGLFTVGIATSITLIGTTSIVIGESSKDYIYYLGSISGLIIITMGLTTLGFFSFSLKLFKNKKNTNKNTTYLKDKLSKANPYLNGIIFGFTLSSCSTPTLVTTTLWIINTKKIIIGACFTFLYSIGYIIPILCLSLTLQNLHNQIKKYFQSEFISILNGSILITIGTTYFLSSFI